MPQGMDHYWQKKLGISPSNLTMKMSRQKRGRQGIRSQVICGEEKSVDPNIIVSLRKECVVIYN